MKLYWPIGPDANEEFHYAMALGITTDNPAWHSDTNCVVAKKRLAVARLQATLAAYRLGG